MPVNEVLLYQTEDGQTQLQVRFGEETVWLTQAQMAELFQTTVPNVNIHIRKVFAEGELDELSTIKDYLIVRNEGGRNVQRTISHYNLDVIISVGYRVKSHRGTQFRRWATTQLREFLIKGFLLNDQRFTEQGTDRYFDELLQRIRDIRSSEKVFWKKVLEIYATSVDYDKNTQMSRQFFATIQNKMHWAAHGHTAAEVISSRADAGQRNMGMTNYPGNMPLKTDSRIAKNYLNPDELNALNLIVSLYLDFAELQALNRRPMTMSAWINKLDEFLRLSEREVLTHAGSISHDEALARAESQYEKWRAKEANHESAVEADFKKAIEASKKVTRKRKKPAAD